MTGPAISLAMIGALAHYVLGFIIGIAVYLDARRRNWLALGIRPIWWAIMCVLGAATGLLAYWVVHYSRLVRSPPGSNNSLERTRRE